MFRNCHSKRDGVITEVTDRDAWERDVKRKLNFSTVELRKNLDLCLLPSKSVLCLRIGTINQRNLSSSRVKKVISAYTDEKPFSVDLVAAVLRQDAFTDKLYHLGWLSTEFFDTDEYERVSSYCIFRYQGYVSVRVLASTCAHSVRQISISDSFTSRFIIRPEHGHRFRLAVSQKAEFTPETLSTRISAEPPQHSLTFPCQLHLALP